MPKKLAVLIIHGMGSQVPGYESQLVAELKDHMEGDPSEVGWGAVYWQDITEQRQLEYLARAREDNPLDWFAVRQFVATALGDAAAYQFGGTGSTYQAIHERIASTVENLYTQELDSKDVPLVVMAHSLGGHIMSNYIWDMQHRRTYEERGCWSEDLSLFQQMKTLAGFITFGSNIPLFGFAYANPTPIGFPGDALADPVRDKSRWLNFYDRDDVLGYPLKALGDLFDQAVDRDIEIDAGSWGAGLTPLSHSAYWTDNSFTKPVAGFLDTLM